MNAPDTLNAAVTPVTADPLWYKDAIIYQLHVKAFFDSNGDGIGDFRGLTQKLDYISELGVNVIWLLPFYPSPMLDDGYDVADYHNVNPAFGTRQDFRTFVREAHRRGLKVITELIINHTSDQHPWFQAARRAPPGSSKRDYYVWTNDPNKYAGTRIIFTDTESSNWAWDELAQAHYWHRFFSHQPDLNFDNPHVLKAVVRVMRFWLDMGVDGFRLDAIAYLVEREGTNNENLPETHSVIRKIRAALDASHQGKVLLAEANQWPEDVRQYFGDGDECHMAYHFPLMPRLFMSIAMEDREPLVDIMAQTPEIPGNCQWAIFLRNHDELTLEMVSDRERAYMYQIFAADPRMRVNVGIRRRLAPLLENSRPQIELISFMLMTMPGSPTLYYGDEIGMGDNIYLGDRNGVRTPMHWSPDRNAGFSRADPQRLYLPPIMDAVYGYQSVNVESQLRSSSSLLHWTRKLIAVRRSYQAFGRGSLRFLQPGNRKVLAYLREYDDEALLCVVNLARTPQAVELDLARFTGRVPVEIMGKASFPPIGKLPYLVTLTGHGYFAFRLATDAPAPAWHQQILPYRQLPPLVFGTDWLASYKTMRSADDLVRMSTNLTHERLRDQILMPYLEERRWYALKRQPVASAEFEQLAVWESPGKDWLLGLLEVRPQSGPAHRYFLPLGIEWEGDDEKNPVERLGFWSLVKIRRKDRVGVIFGAFGSPDFARALVRAMGTNAEIPHGRGRLRFSTTSAYRGVDEALAGEVTVPALEQSNTGIFIGRQFYLKGYRRLDAGRNLEVEIGRFLTDTSPFAHIAPAAGAVEYVEGPEGGPDDGAETLAVLQQFVENQGDAWTFTLDHLERVLGQPLPSETAQPEGGPHAFYFGQLALLATRIAQLHHAFARKTGDPAFEPDPVSVAEIEAWKVRVAGDATDTLALLETARAQLPGDVAIDADKLLGAKGALVERIQSLALAAPGMAKTRYHGDLHLGQVLLAQNDFVIIDFEGEPGRPIEERRAKHCPLRDVAGMIRSLDYAAHATLNKLGGAKADAAPLATALAEWRERASEIFLRSYDEAAGDLVSIPAGLGARRAMLRLFEIEKALYELRYEINQRPDWVSLPLRGLLVMVEV